MSARSLPPALQEAVRSTLDARASDLKLAAAALSSAYGKTAQSSAVSLDAYLTVRLPATYAAVSRVFELVAEVAGGFAPSSMLDIGAGPGTASWAAVEQWPMIATVTMVEKDARFSTLAAKLAQTSEYAALSKSTIVQSDLKTNSDEAALVVAAYVFAEQNVSEAAGVALRLWAQTQEILVIIEPGTPDGFARILTAREALLKGGAHMVGPCTHVNACPRAGDDWCHFKTRLSRSRAHMQAKGAIVPFEDESFSFIAVSRHKLELPTARIVAPISTNKVAANLPLCDVQGLHGLDVASRDKAAYKRAKKKLWGDAWP